MIPVVRASLWLASLTLLAVACGGDDAARTPPTHGDALDGAASDRDGSATDDGGAQMDATSATDAAAVNDADASANANADADADAAAGPKELLSWTAGYASPTGGWSTTTTRAAAGTSDGTFMGTGSAAVDAARGLVYVTDTEAHRIVKISASTGAMLGWIGAIGEPPTGGAASCAGATTVTPGWCTGGTSAQGSGDGRYDKPSGIAIDAAGTTLYVSDRHNHRVVRIDASTGVFTGWIGHIAIPPSGGDAGCAGASSFATPGWCMGGASAVGNGDGAFSFAYGNGVALDAAGAALYVADFDHLRVTKHSVATGAFLGWIGTVATTPTGGAAGCTSAAPGDLTPGFCTGGTSATPSGYGLTGVTVDAAGHVYTVGNFGAINRYDATTGAPEGWIGDVQTAPTGGAPGCTTTLPGSATPGWCTGGASSLSGPYVSFGGLMAAGGSIYVPASGRSRLERIDAMTGLLSGWIGQVQTTPTGGDAGCTSALPKSLTPGWCTGGAAQSSKAPGSVVYGAGVPAIAVSGAAQDIYLPDGLRLQRFGLASGVFSGWTGGVATPTIGWSSDRTRLPQDGSESGFLDFNGGYGVTGLALEKSGSTLYALSTKIDRIDTTTGKSTGWIGFVDATPTGGAVGCASAQPGSATPGWCTGGASTQGGRGVGGVEFPSDLALDPKGVYLYVADSLGRSVHRFAIATGAFAGWTGIVGVVPTSGDAGCTSANIGSHTPGWCLGGHPGGSAGSTRLALDPTGATIYALEYSGHRLAKFDAATGAELGWVGAIAGSPTGGDSGCNGAAVGTYTPGWCTGGAAAQAPAGSGFQAARQLAINVAGTQLYVGDLATRVVDVATGQIGATVLATAPTLVIAPNGAVIATNPFDGLARYTAAFVTDGWFGRIATSPTGGDPGCAGAMGTGITPGWCTGGTPKSGIWLLAPVASISALAVNPAAPKEIYYAVTGDAPWSRLVRVVTP